MSAIDCVKAELDDVITIAVYRLADFRRTLTLVQKAQIIEQLEGLFDKNGGSALRHPWSWPVPSARKQLN